MRFRRTLNYSSVNEDWRTETTALGAGPGHVVLCVTGGGDRPLDMLAASPERVVAIDMNPAQNHLLALKVAAMQELTFEEFTSFLGLHRAERAWRLDRLRSLGPALPPHTRDFWCDHREMVAEGVLYQGRWERFYRRFAVPAVEVMWPGVVAALFAFDDVDEQHEFAARHWDTARSRWAFRVVCSRSVSRFVLGDPGYYRYAEIPVGTFLHERMLATLRRYLARENFMLSLVLRGRLAEEDLPPYLTPGGVATIRPRLDRVEIVTENLVEHMQDVAPDTYARFSLSDVPSFLDAAGFDRLVEGVSRAGAPGARFCIRQFVTRRPWSEKWATRLTRESGLEARLAAEDRSLGYEFLVGEVRGT